MEYVASDGESICNDSRTRCARGKIKTYSTSTQKSGKKGRWEKVKPDQTSIIVEVEEKTKRIHESSSESGLGTDIVPFLLSVNHIRRIVREVNFNLVNIRIALKYTDKILKASDSCFRPKLQ